MFVPVLLALTTAQRFTVIIILAINLGAVSVCCIRQSRASRR